MKKFVDDGMFLQMKITLIICQKEYLHYESKWWLHSNKQGSNTMPLTHRSDFKQALSTLQRLQQEAAHVPTYSYNGRHKVHLLHGGIGKVSGGLLIIQKVKKVVSQVLSERGGKNLRKRLSQIPFILLQIDRLQLTAVYCNRRGV